MKSSRWKGSLTVEAALVMPIFMFAVIAFLYLFQLFTLEERIQESITRVSKEASQYGYVYYYLQGELQKQEDKQQDSKVKQVMQGFIDGTMFRTKFLEYMGNQTNDNCIVGGIQGISFLESCFMKGDDNIEVVAIYEAKIPVLFFHIHPFTIVQRVHSRAFIGENLVDKGQGTKEDKDTYVYITRTGTVYHKDCNCTYLNVKLQSIQGKNIAARRNKSGAIYYPCESCMRKELDPNQTYYITTYGNRYHVSCTCNKIEREISKIKLSEVEARKPCSKCGK